MDMSDGARPAPPAFELAGPLPDAYEHILQGFFGERSALQDPHHAGEKLGRGCGRRAGVAPARYAPRIAR